MDIFRRTIQQIKRFKSRNSIIAIQIVLIVFLISALSTIYYQMGQLFENKETSYVKQLTVIKVLDQSISNELLTYLHESDKVNFHLPFSNFYKSNDLYMELNDYYVSGIDIVFFNPDEVKNFEQNELIDLVKSDYGIILPMDFDKSIIPKIQYNKLYGESILPDARLLESYKSLLLSQNELRPKLSYESIKFKFYNEFISDSIDSFSIPISGKFVSEYQIDQNNFLFIPSEYQDEIINKSNVDLRKNLIIKTSDISDVPSVLNNIKKMGYIPQNNFKIYKEEMEQNRNILHDLLVLIMIIAGISIMNIVNILYSTLQERKKEIAIMKALGISKKQFLLFFITETILIVSASTIIGFVFIEGLFYLIQHFIQVGVISKDYFHVYNLDQQSAQMLFDTSWLIYVVILIFTILISLIVTYFPVLKMYNKPYSKLIK